MIYVQFLLIGIGSFLSILFVLQLIKGNKYDHLIENLDNDTYPLYFLYGVGFSWSSSKLFSLKGETSFNLKLHAGLLYGSQYAEYYANVVWAQTLTLVHFFATLTFLLATLFYNSLGLMLVAGTFIMVFAGIYCLEKMKNVLAERTEECELQLSEVVSALAILVNSGMVLREAWFVISKNSDGAIYELMREASEKMKNGYSDSDAIFLFGKASNSADIKKFSSALLQSMEKGGAELSFFLFQQSSELWNVKKQRMLQNGEKASAKLLFPTLLIFVGVIIIIMTAAFAGSLF